MLKLDESVTLSDEMFRLLRDYFHDYCGIFFDEGSRGLFEKRLARRLKILHISDFKEYYRFLRYDRRKEEELVDVMDVLTINETYFFREQRQLDAFSREILPELKNRKGRTRRLRIWSAGCSTGEEPYTLAMLIMEDPELRDWDIQILGSDINQRVLGVARLGVYRQNSFRTTDAYYLRKYFEQEEDGSYRIVDGVKRYVSLGNLNLLDSVRTRLLEPMDIVFCRNVLIYFDVTAKKKVMENFNDRLVGGGWLLLGHSESLMNISTAFSLRHLKNDMVYQKAVPGALP